MAVTVRISGDFVVRAGAVLPPRVLSDWEIVYFPCGSSTEYRIGTKRWVLSRPALVLTPPGEEHEYIFDRHQATRHLFVHFHWQGDAWGEIADLPSVVSAATVPISGQCFQQALSLIYRRDPGWRLRATTLMTAVILEMIGTYGSAQQETRRPDPPLGVLQALTFIEEHLGEPIQVSDIAQSVGWSPAHLARMLTKWIGQSPTQALLQVRIARACTLLENSQLTIAEVAQAVGFTDANYFSRLFPRVKGMAASEYRRTCLTDARMANTAVLPPYSSAYPLNQPFLTST